MEQANTKNSDLGIFEKYLTLWVFLCMITGVLIGIYFPQIPAFLQTFEYANVSIPIAILIWLMIYPMMLKIDFSSIKKVGENPRGLVITWVVNWLIKPFTMYVLAWFFFSVVFKKYISPELGKQYLAGAVLLGAAPCTAMVFVWSHLTKGNPAYTLVQVATNDLIILIAYVPIVGLLLGIGGMTIPWKTLFLSVLLFVVIPLLAGWGTRIYVTRRHGLTYFENTFIPKFGSGTILGLLLTLVIIFSFQGQTIVDNPFAIVLIAVPLILQTFLIFFIAYFWSKAWALPHDIAAPAALIGASNFFELAVAVAISVFGVQSGAAVATIVGVLVEVPVMLTLVRIAKKTKNWFPR
ncbi:ACR3 family arsenite efflux transporter [uncultured Sphaerochaeta sp.]|uniref:ACR3 family arsenite efflux transporter n=1 Tax=uncultured Sphaerochaeta sp. TaxID=886478 RepID=UPI002A0A3190|nr:ACR3 family arsenite efflux transporter [uncultured Sphaerochaeta sp.]